MFKTKNNLRRNAKHKGHKNTKKSSSYVEDYNEVILNDLVENNESNNQDNVQEKPIRKKKRKKSINLNLGTKKKSTSDDDKNEKGKTLNKKYKSDNNEPKEIIGAESKKDTIETEVQPKDNKSPKSKKVQKESKKLSKKKSQKQSSEANTKKTKKKTTKKENNTSKENKGKKTVKKPRKEEEINTKAVEEIEVEEVNDQEDTVVEGNVFRNIKENEEFVDKNLQVEIEEEKTGEHKFDDIIWSDDKFPKN